MARGVSATYFVPVHPVIWAIIVLGLFVQIPMMIYTPSLLAIFGPYGAFLRSASEGHIEQIEQFFHICLAVHVGEAVLGWILCVRLGLDTTTKIKWLLNVGVNGVFALRFLVWPQLDQKNGKKKR